MSNDTKDWMDRFVGAAEQGWDIFYCYGSEAGDWQLQRIDEPEEGEPIFEDDHKAWEFVYKQFLVGDVLAKNALTFLSIFCREEFLRIKKHCEETVVRDGLYNPV